MENYNEQAKFDGPPIAMLHRDLLWQIFALNADIEEGPKGVINVSDTDNLFRLSPLTNARYASQVCASWRELIIGSPSLWGNMIDLQSLDQTSDTWRNEVLLRTGDSQLSISGNVPHDTQGAQEFLVLLLKNHWARISRVRVQIDNYDTQNWPKDAWSALGCPAPSLKSFSIYFQYYLPYVCASPEFSLFANHAPLLTHFQQNRLPVKFGASWLTNLTSLTVNLPTTLGVLLDACSRMRSLKNLSIAFWRAGPHLGGQLLSVNTPSLTSLDISCPLHVSLAFLDHITPAPGCYLRLSSTVTDNDGMTPSELVSAQRVIAKFADNYFSHRNSTSMLHLQFAPRIMVAGDILVEDNFYENLKPWHQGFMISIFGTPGIPTSLVPLCLGTLVPAHLSHVKTFRLHIEDVAPITHPLEHSLPDFLITMTSLENLKLSTGGFIFFSNSLARVNQQNLFPRLQTIAWNASDIIRTPDKTSLIMDLLVTLRKIGMPIKTFDLTQWHSLSAVPMDVKKLEEVSGLKVLWKEQYGVGDNYIQREYVCGSGRPQELGQPLSIIRASATSDNVNL